jgi:hemerythrin
VDEKYFIGIFELDAQHEEIVTVLTKLGDALDDPGRRPEIAGILGALAEKLRFHFHYEESVMQIASYPEIQEHRRAHEVILEAVENYRKADAAGADLEFLQSQGKLPMRLFSEQVINHDARFARFVMAHKDRLGVR